MRHARFITAVAIGIGGTVLVFQLLDWMNAAAPLPEKKALSALVDFTVAPQRREQLPQRVQRPRPQPQRTSQPRAPLPNLATALSGVSFGIPPLAAGAFSGAQDSLLGADSAIEDVVMTARSVDAPPRPVEQVPPRHPPRARAEGISGQVKLRLLVDREGRVSEAKVLDATPEGVFDDAALSAIRQWRYAPATYRGQPVRMWAEMVMRFNLG